MTGKSKFHFPQQTMLTIRAFFIFSTIAYIAACGEVETHTNEIQKQTKIQETSSKHQASNKENNEMIVTKRRHVIDKFITFGGKTIKNVQVGWESYGELNADKSNVILITHYFTGNSHAAGKYHLDDEEPGYWDSIIGPDKAIDTNRFFVISVDSLVNINAYDPNTITTGPASINPETGKAYGLDFPVVTMRDFVNVQKSVLESLGINKLYAVAGPSMGSMQAIEWASAYPEWVDRLISVIGSSTADAWTTTALEQWTVPIRLDPHFNDGNYYEQPKNQWPNEGLAYALAFITQIALHPEFFIQTGEQLGYTPLEADVLSNINNKPSMVNWLMSRARERTQFMDANHLLYLVRANQLFLTGMGASLEQGLSDIQAKVLFIPATTDLLLMPYHAELAHRKLQENDQKSELVYLEGSLGHLEGLAGVAKHAQTIKAFLEE